MTYKNIIIGGGISGLIILKELIQEKQEVILLEKKNKPGGIWKHKIPEWQTIQNSISDWSIDGIKISENSKSGIVKYIEAYIDKFKLQTFIKTKVNVIDCKFKNNKWSIYTKNRVYITTNLIIATGQHNIKNYPILDISKFKGKYFHSIDIEDLSILKNKRVAIVGAKASGLDAVKNCLEKKAKSINWIYRKLYWFGSEDPDPNNTNGLIYFSLLQLLKIPNMIINKIIESKFRKNYLKYNAEKLIPNYKFNIEEHMVIPGRNIILKKNKKINFYENEIKYFDGNNIILKNQDIINDIDIIIFATGFKLQLPFLNNEISNSIDKLYNRLSYGIIDKKYKNLYFFGPGLLNTTSSTPVSCSVLQKYRHIK